MRGGESQLSLRGISLQLYTKKTIASSLYRRRRFVFSSLFCVCVLCVIFMLVLGARTLIDERLCAQIILYFSIIWGG